MTIIHVVGLKTEPVHPASKRPVGAQITSVRVGASYMVGNLQGHQQATKTPSNTGCGAGLTRNSENR